MLYNYDFDVAALILNAMLLLVVYMRHTYDTKACTLYKVMLWLNLAACILDILSAFTISYAAEVPLALNYFICVGYLIVHNLSAVTFLVYVLVLVRGNFGKKYERVFWISVTAIDLVALLTTPFTKAFIYFNDQFEYCHGPLMVILYITAFLTIIYSGYLFLKHRSILNTFQLITNVVFILLIMAAVVIQYIFPDYLLESFFAAIAFMMMNVALDNPATYFYKNTYCFNKTSFEYTVGDLIKNNEPFTVLAFTFEDLLVYRKKYESSVYEKIIFDTIDKCHAAYGEKVVYALSDGKFAIFIGDKDPYEEVRAFDITVGKNIKVNDEETISLTPHYCVLKHPGFVTDVVETVDAINIMLDDEYKSTGRHIIICTQDLLETKHRQAEIIHLLHDAIQNDGFEIKYQPIIDRTTNKIVSAEALLRLKKKSSTGFVGPDEFIPIAEQNGLIIEIGEIVLTNVCRFWTENDLASLGIRYIDVNLSMMQLLKRNTVENLREICYHFGVEPKHINFEITETAYASESQKADIDECIAYLRERNFSLSLDDYGSGYSTATYLAEMPFSMVKIDKGILWNAMSDKNFRIVLTQTVRLVHEFGRLCVCEGVENAEMVDLLSELGCDLFQGYLYAKPLSEEDFLEFVNQNKA